MGRGGYTLTMRESHGASTSLLRLAESRMALNTATVHVGWGSFRNLDIAAARRSSRVLLLDINTYQLKVWEAVASAIRQPDVTTPRAFINTLVPLLPHTPRLRQFSESTHDWLSGDLERPESWLYEAEPESFEFIKTLFTGNRVAIGCLDMRAGGLPEHSPFTAMAGEMQTAQLEHQIVFDTLYVSNIPWMLAQPLGFFGESHQSRMTLTDEPVLQRLHHNLSQIVPGFQTVVSAAHLSADALPDNLQWETQLVAPVDFLSAEYWQALEKKPDCFDLVVAPAVT